MNIKQTLLSSIGQKLLLATSGLVMFLLFLIPHMGGNILFLFGPDLFNSYAAHLHQLVPIVIGIEVLMLISITGHMIMAFRVVFYVLFMVAVGMHLSHALQSTLQLLERIRMRRRLPERPRR